MSANNSNDILIHDILVLTSNNYSMLIHCMMMKRMVLERHVLNIVVDHRNVLPEVKKLTDHYD